MNAPSLSFAKFAEKYCETQDSTPEALKEILVKQVEEFSPRGFVLLECVQMDSSRLGSRCILPYGHNNTLKSVPSDPISPRGLASDMSVVIGVLPVGWLTPERQ